MPSYFANDVTADEQVVAVLRMLRDEKSVQLLYEQLRADAV